MQPLIATLIALAGTGLTLFGAGRYVRGSIAGRTASASPTRTRWRRRGALAYVAVGATMFLVPDAPARWSGQFPEGQAPLELFLVFYRLAAVGGLLVVAAVMATAAGVGAFRTKRANARLRVAAPSPAPAQPGALVPDLTEQWTTLLDRDTTLTRQFLSYDHDLDAAINFPAMRDYRDPLTRAALDAMLHCDEVRTQRAPASTTDVHATAYGQAVAQFAVALAAAEANARRLVWSNFTDDERRALDTAGKMLAFLQANSTTPAEREVAYARVIAELGKIPRTKFALGEDALRRALEASAATSPTRPHPWLDVEQRATRAGG